MELEYKKQISKALLLLLVVLSISILVGMFHKGRYGGRMGGNEPVPSLTLSGHGEVQAVPDIATLNFSVESGKATQKESSDEVNTKVSKVLSFLKESGVAEKDIKTDNYNSYPKYSNPKPCPYYSDLRPCAQESSEIIGYNVSQSVTVKVRKVDDVSKVIDGINKIGVTNMSGPTLSIDDEEGLKAEARKVAIDDAKNKAKVLARQLGVRLVRITSFNESGNYYPTYARGAGMMKDSSEGAPVPSEIPKGENTISSDVNITYEIR